MYGVRAVMSREFSIFGLFSGTNVWCGAGYAGDGGIRVGWCVGVFGYCSRQCVGTKRMKSSPKPTSLSEAS